MYGGNIGAARTPFDPIFKYYAILMKFKTIDSNVCGFESTIERPLHETMADCGLVLYHKRRRRVQSAMLFPHRDREKMNYLDCIATSAIMSPWKLM